MNPSFDPALQDEPMFSFLDLVLYRGKGEKFNEFIYSPIAVLNSFMIEEILQIFQFFSQYIVSNMDEE